MYNKFPTKNMVFEFLYELIYPGAWKCDKFLHLAH